MISDASSRARVSRFGPLRRFLAGLTLSGLLACAVVQQTPGIEVRFEVVHDAIFAGEVEQGPRSFETVEGVEVTLSTAYLTLSSLELVACEQARAAAPLAWTSVAWAHGTSTPTLLASPFVNGLERPDLEPALWGVVKPPPGTYCALRVTLAPADEDAAGLPANHAVVGQTLWLQGSWWSEEQAEPIPLEVRVSLVGVATLPLPNGPWILTGEESLPTFRLKLAYDQWLENVPLEGGDPDVLAVSLFQAVLDSLSLEQRDD